MLDEWMDGWLSQQHKIARTDMTSNHGCNDDDDHRYRDNHDNDDNNKVQKVAGLQPDRQTRG